jgi:cytochrome P450
MQSSLGASVTLEQLDRDPHPVLARLREHEPVAWIPAFDGWLVTSYELALAAMRDDQRFTVDDPRFSTARVIGPSMLSLDGPEHRRHRAPFVAPFRPGAVRTRFAVQVENDANRLLDGLEPAGGAELRRSFAGPLAAATIARALGLDAGDSGQVLGWYDAIVTGVNEISVGRSPPPESARAFAQLSRGLSGVLDEHQSLTRSQITSNAAVLLFGGIETTEGMIANALLHLLERPDELRLVRHDPNRLDAAIEESLRLEPAAAVIDRYATADVTLGPVRIRPGDLVRISIAGANRDPSVFPDPDEYRPQRSGARRHLAFAHGPHVCVGLHLARLETRIGLATLLDRLADLRLDGRHHPAVRGLVFRKPVELNATWS